MRFPCLRSNLRCSVEIEISALSNGCDEWLCDGEIFAQFQNDAARPERHGVTGVKFCSLFTLFLKQAFFVRYEIRSLFVLSLKQKLPIPIVAIMRAYYAIPSPQL